MWLSVIFNTGRIVTYAVLGLAVGIAGGAFLVDAAFAQWGAVVFGALVVGIGLWIAVRRARRRCDCPSEASWARRLLHRIEPRDGKRGEAYMGLMGLLMGLVPCPPLIALLVFAAASGSAATGFVLGLIFGIGTLLSPMFFIAAAAGWFSDRVSKEAPLMTPGVQRAAGVILIALGAWTMYNAISSDSLLL